MFRMKFTVFPCRTFSVCYFFKAVIIVNIYLDNSCILREEETERENSQFAYGPFKKIVKILDNFFNETSRKEFL